MSPFFSPSCIATTGIILTARPCPRGASRPNFIALAFALRFGLDHITGGHTILVFPHQTVWKYSDRNTPKAAGVTSTIRLRYDYPTRQRYEEVRVSCDTRACDKIAVKINFTNQRTNISKTNYRPLCASYTLVNK